MNVKNLQRDFTRKRSSTFVLFFFPFSISSTKSTRERERKKARQASTFSQTQAATKGMNEYKKGVKNGVRKNKV